jgi:SAM-dependent methyltransferase
MTKESGIPIDEEPDAPSADYRQSHLERGGTYDATLGGSPFDAYMAKWEAHWLANLVAALHDNGIPRYLDFACGTGRITRTVAPHARESIGIDVSHSMLEVARTKCPGTRFIEADITRTSLDLGKFDLLTSFRFFGNAQDALRHEVLTALARLLRPGGHLIVNNHRNPLSTSAFLHRITGGSHGMDLTYFKFRRMLRKSGFALVKAQPIGFWLFRSGMQSSSAILDAGASRERWFGSRIYAPFAPDMILVARKR